jgi:hypothetical protein
MNHRTLDPFKGKFIIAGTYSEDGKTFVRDVIDSKHFMRIHNGYGMQEAAFQELVKRDVRIIIQRIKLTQDTWVAGTDVWLEKGVVTDYGHGDQRFLDLSHMTKTAHTPNDFGI